jgi:hypothetical protein
MAKPFCVVLLMCLAIRAAACDAGEPVDRVASDKQSLAPLQAYVGQWRGVGQVRRGSSRGAWTETAEWSWHFKDGRASLVAILKDGKYFSRLELLPADATGQFVLLATPATIADSAAPAPIKFEGKQEGDALSLNCANAPDTLPARITIRMVAKGDRMVVLYEKRLGDVYTRLGEVGSTRVGSSFATAAASGPECVVTGGLGTIAVEYEGQKYFVCCTGCRDLFEEDPAGVLAEYRQRKADEKQKRQPGQ